jgi:hypothetical protein
MPLYKKRRPNLKIYTYPNSKCDLLRRDDMNAKLRLKKGAYKSKSQLVLKVALPSRTQSLKAAIVFDRDVTVNASSKNELNPQNLRKTVKFLVSTLFFFSRTMCLGFTITASWSKMPLLMRKLSFTSEVKFVYLLFLRNFTL